MPDRTSYDEAMLYARHTLKLQEPEIKQGAVETYAVKTAVGEIKKPWGREGGFAVVYKFRTRSGQSKAMRCFRSAIATDIRERYERMSRFFRQHVPDITIDFRYYEDGILVKESAQSSQKKVCPMIVMEWIEGVTLLDKVDELCKQRERRALGVLAEQWLDILRKMRQVQMAHGDLAGVNVMVRPDGRMVLIDYDGVYIPEFAAMPQVVIGQQGYQHPDMHNRSFDERMDDFSGLVIYLSLLALQLRPELWESYTKRNETGQLDGTMLFTHDDFVQPDRSLLFRELARSGDPRVRDLTHRLIEHCKQPIEQVRFPLELFDPDYAVKHLLRQFERAIQYNNDELVLRLWVEPLASYGPAQTHLPRVDAARQRVVALRTLRQALASQDIFQIAAVAGSAPSARLNNQERAIIQLADDFARAYRGDDDEQILKSWQEIGNGPYRAVLKLGTFQQQRLVLAQQRKDALTRFRLVCLHSHSAHEIVNAYATLPDSYPGFSRQEREQVDAARRYLAMYDAVRNALLMNNGEGDLSKLLEVYDEELAGRFHDFTEREREQISALRSMGRLERALLAKAHRLALVTAREIEMQMRAPLNNPRLSFARKHFIKSFDPRNVQVYLRGGQAFARWDWPDDELVQFAVLAWRSDGWPLHPRKDEVGRTLLRVTRNFYEQYNGFQFPIGMAAQIYVQVFFAIFEISAQTGEQTWFYSRGSEPTSKWPLQSPVAWSIGTGS